MADNTTTKVLEVVVDNNKAVTAISEYNRLIDEQKAKQMALAKAYQEGKISQSDYYKAMAQSKEVTKTYSRQVQELSKEIQNNIKMDTEKQGSLRALRAELSNVTKQYDELSEEERRAAKGLELQSKINAITASLKSSEQETGRFYRNVGNYANGFVEAFTRMGGSMGGLQGPLNIAKNGFMALSSTPLIAILGALVSIIQKVIQNLKSSEASMQAVTVALAPLNAGSRLLQKTMQALGSGIAKVAERLGRWAEKLGLVTEEMKVEQQLVKDDIALQMRERDIIRENADSQLKISQLRAKAADKLNYTEKERIEFLKQAVAEEDAVAKREMEVAAERYRILEEQSKLAENSKEENDELARAYADMVNAEKSYYDKSRELQAQITEATNAARAKEKERIDKERQALAELAEARVNIMKEGIDKERAQETANHEKKLAELRDRLKTEQNLSETAKAAINQQIELEEQRHAQKMAQLDIQATNERLEREKQTLELKLGTAIKGSEEEYKLKQQQLQTQMEMELQNVKLTEEQKQLIRENYQKKEAQLAEERNAQILEASRLEYENQIAEMALRQENTLQMELQMKQAELDALHQLEGESDAEFRARQLAAMKEVADKKKEIADYEVSIEQTKYEAISQITGGLRSVLEAFGEENKAAAKAAKVLALAEIAINTGKAIAAGIAQSQSVPFPANLGAIATTITAVLSGIASAISTVKSAKFATGGYVSGPGTGTSDSIPARLSNGESVINARSTAMFGPLLSSLNQAGGGVAFNPAAGGQREGYEFLAAAVAAGMKSVNLHVAVDEVTKVQDRVARIDEISSIG
ncbi:hypothetical protein [Succinimonas sp.]|uniref:hypothetical protein n=1 Tax=Succinimonas sp. TaxID=1936151 RepID=UPI00386E0220